MTERLFVFSEPKPPGTFTGRLESTGEVIVERTDRPLVEAARRLGPKPIKVEPGKPGDRGLESTDEECYRMLVTLAGG